MLDEQVGEDGQHVVGSEPSLWHHRQAFTAVLIDDVQHSVLAAVVGDVLDEVVAPDMTRPLGAQPDA